VASRMVNQGPRRGGVELPAVHNGLRTALRSFRFRILRLYYGVLVHHFKIVKSLVWKYPQSEKFKSGRIPQFFKQLNSPVICD
jgi:hypothetical protein